MHFSTLLLTIGTLTLVASSPLEKRVSRFKYFGVNLSGAEWGQQNIPGTKNTDYVWPTTATIDNLFSNGFNTFRVAFLMERLVPTSLTGTTNAAYLADLKTTVNYITGKGAYAVVEPHNYGRYYNSVITNTAGFQAFWKTVAAPFSGNSKVIFDTNNEYHDMDQTLVLNLNQAAINGIRSAGATSQTIFVEGNSYSGAWTWPTVNDNLKALTDPQNKLVYEMHQYLDSDGSGTSATCVSTTIGKDRVTAATQWLKTNGKKGILGEFAGGANTQCKTAVTGLINYLASNTDVWQGALWWAAGPWWGTYIYSFEPTSGTGYTYYLSTLKSLF